MSSATLFDSLVDQALGSRPELALLRPVVEKELLHLSMDLKLKGKTALVTGGATFNFELAGANGIPVIEAFARVSDLRRDDGMLLTSSVRGIVPVGSVDAHELLVADELLAQLRALVDAAETASAAAFRARYR